ncbi:MAG: aminoacyl-tRNA hydrolase [Anaeroplasmataceae bacterium]|nr:aminoacyl-tRNA hydrolase [Anaeroplasmataceae bacterium]
MKLIVGLGNPGAQYEQTRHNVGFMAIDSFAEKYNASFRLEPKLKGMLASVTLNGNKAFLLKPMTFMNLSGESVKAVKDYYKIDVEDILIISDDLDSHNGRVRLRAEGSAGGHNGHKNIIAHLGTEEYKRIKIGIGRSEVIPVIDWVLQKFNNEDLAEIRLALDKASHAIEDFISGVAFNKISSLYSSK